MPPLLWICFLLRQAGKMSRRDRKKAKDDAAGAGSGQNGGVVDGGECKEKKIDAPHVVCWAALSFPLCALVRGWLVAFACFACFTVLALRCLLYLICFALSAVLDFLACLLRVSRAGSFFTSNTCYYPRDHCVRIVSVRGMIVGTVEVPVQLPLTSWLGALFKTGEAGWQI